MIENCPICGMKNDGSWSQTCWGCWFKIKGFFRKEEESNWCPTGKDIQHYKNYCAKSKKEKVEFT